MIDSDFTSMYYVFSIKKLFNTTSYLVIISMQIGQSDQERIQADSGSESTGNVRYAWKGNVHYPAIRKSRMGWCELKFACNLAFRNFESWSYPNFRKIESWWYPDMAVKLLTV